MFHAAVGFDVVCLSGWVVGQALLWLGLQQHPFVPQDKLVLRQPHGLPITFPRVYRFSYAGSIMLYLALSFGGAIGLAWVMIYLFELSLTRQPDSLLCITQTNFILMALFSFFLCLGLLPLPYKVFTSRFPGYDQFQAIENYATGLVPEYENPDNITRRRQQALTQLDRSMLAQAEWHRFYKTAFWVWLVCIPLMLLGLRHYALIEPEGITVQTYSSLVPMRYTWEEVDHLALSSRLEYDSQDSNYDLIPQMTLKSRNGHDIWEFWESLGYGSPDESELTAVLRAIHNNHVPIRIQPVTLEQKQALQSYTPEAQARFWQVYREAKRLNRLTSTRHQTRPAADGSAGR